MAVPIPPIPTRSEPGSFVWISFYQRLQAMFTEPASLGWDIVDKTGSSLSDIQARDHAMLTAIEGSGTYHISMAEQALVTDLNTTGHNGLPNIDGTGTYHVSMAEGANITALPAAANLVVKQFFTLAADPVAANIPAGQFAVYKNSTSGLLKLWGNDGGTLKSVTLV